MKKTIYTFIGLSFFLSLSISGQALQEENRAVFLTKYYSEYQNKLNSNISNDTIETSQIEEKTIADSLLKAKK